VGYVGSTGRATAAHLHFEVRVNDTPVNPWRYLAGPSRVSAQVAGSASAAGS
jgi:murein DD-endopeptidase MepM/ murein hydrolase activator NlpD